MLEFKIIVTLKPNTEILEVIKNYTLKRGHETYPTTLTILKYIVNEITLIFLTPFYCSNNPISSSQPSRLFVLIILLSL